ncbi:hypothetical protein GQ597_10465 [Gilliamella sp. Pra-s65]|uniref:hypothetical protein n=1 Tax=unclassified Gilliamella TaxID=2685620 RepID=UPI0013662F9C|nr:MULTISPECIES: hypothetical protein [unclassified Gilliamella]MWN91125.1 hypothetical protein [Gilliamella sp. Pra-s65]MWP73951.1 hypothetical protein [Gilliamella sp. Pra-s52]
MKNFLFNILLLILLPPLAYASNIDSNKNHYYLIMKDKINVEKQEKDWFIGALDNLITGNKQKISISGCDFKRFEGNKKNINNQLKKINFFENYDEELNKYNLLLNDFDELFLIDSSNLSEMCIGFSYTTIILLNDNELMIPYKQHLIFYKQLVNTDENKINNLKRNENCLQYKQVDMETTHTCYYQNMTILDVYEAMSFDPSNVFRKKIKIGEDFSDIYEDDYLRVEVEYKWKGENKLEIVQYFDGGVTYYTFVNQENRTKLITKLSPD